MIKKILKHPLFWVILGGFLIRFYGVLTFPVKHDEIISILNGVKKTEGGLINFFFRASLVNCLGMTPFYFWIERFFIEIFGQNNIGLRFFPLLSGITTPILVYFAVKKYFKERIAFLSAFFVAFSSNFIWSTSKSQYFEVLILPILFLIFYFTFSKNKNRFFLISFLFFLIFFTYFGKAMALFLTFLAWYLFTKIVELWWKKSNLLEISKEVFQIFSSFSILLFWLILSQIFVFSNGPIESEVGLGKVSSVWKMIFLTTFGYGIASKQFLSGSQRGAFLIYDNIHIWPTETLLFIPFLMGLILAFKNLFRNLKEKDIERFKMNSFLLISAILPLCYIFFLGIISARFHFLYFVPFIILSAIGFEKIFDLPKENKKIAILIFFIFCAYLSYVSSWESWYYKVFNWEKFYLFFGFGAIFTLFYALVINTQKNLETVKNFLISFFLFSIVFLNLINGPFIWGKRAEWEPAFDNKLKPCPTCYAEKNEEELVNFAIIKKRPEICHKLPADYKKNCLEKINENKK
jgi:4-amino-4-deoxy-L-arabinose transferase-like glycosyltransferase